MFYLIGWGLSLLWCKFTWGRQLYCCTDSLFGCGFFLWIFCKLTLCLCVCHCIGQFTSAVCVSVVLCFDSTIHYFTNCFLLLGLLIQLFWLFYFVLYFGWLTVPHKNPLSGARRFKGPRADTVPVLWSTRSMATLLGKQPEGSSQWTKTSPAT